MKLLLTLTALLVAVLAPGLQDPDAERIDVPAHFEPFAPLVGKTWRGTFPGGGLHDTQEFAWMYGGKFLRNTHAVSRPNGEVVYEGEAIYGWDHAAERVRWWYFNATGGIVTGDLVEVDGRFVAEGTNNAPAGQTDRVRSEFVLGPDDWESRSFFLEDGAWKERFTMEFREVE